MIPPALYKKPVGLDREAHRDLRVKPHPDFSFAGEMNSVFLAAVEFSEASKEYPIVFVQAGKHPETGKDLLAPVAVLGLKPSENLFLKDKAWTASYTPALLRRYPFAMVRVDNDNFAVVFDESWPGFSKTEGEPLFDADGKPTQFLENARAFLESFERDTEQTRLLCEELQNLGILQETRFEAKNEAGESLVVEGFYALNNEKFAALDDATVLRLHRNGILGLLHLQQSSLGNMRRLAERRAAAEAAAQPVPTPAPTEAPAA